MKFGIQLGNSQSQNDFNTSSFQEIQSQAPPDIKKFEPQSELNQYQEQQFLKNQSFQNKKQYISRALLLILIKQIIILILYQFYYTDFFIQNVYLPLSTKTLGLVYIALTIITRFSFCQTTPIAQIIFIIFLFLEPCVILCVYFFMVREIGIIGYYIMMLRFFCSIFQVLVVQLYICFEKQAIQYKKALIMFGIAACIYNLIILVGEGEINFVTILVLSISIIIMAISGLIFIYVLNQIFEGRFSVKVNQVFGMANVFNFGLLFPCNF